MRCNAISLSSRSTDTYPIFITGMRREVKRPALIKKERVSIEIVWSLLLLDKFTVHILMQDTRDQSLIRDALAYSTPLQRKEVLF